MSHSVSQKPFTILSRDKLKWGVVHLNHYYDRLAVIGEGEMFVLKKDFILRNSKEDILGFSSKLVHNFSIPHSHQIGKENYFYSIILGAGGEKQRREERRVCHPITWLVA